ncbi:MAG: sulfite exporter TauE/SafE family protein [Microcoleaceae cyanobacterium]
MTPIELIILSSVGLIAGILAGFLGIGGGTILVPILVKFGYSPVEAVATSSLSIIITAISGSVQNWRMGYLDFRRVIGIGLPAIITAQIGVYLANLLPSYLLLLTFGCLLWLNIFLIGFRKQVTERKKQAEARGEVFVTAWNMSPILARIFTGSAAGLLAGLFGVGGGIIIVPLQILLLGEPIKVAIQTSLGVIVITAIASTTGHAINGHVLWLIGCILGFGGLLGAQISTRFLPKIPDQIISIAFSTLLGILSVYIFWRAWLSYQS